MISRRVLLAITGITDFPPPPPTVIKLTVIKLYFTCIGKKWSELKLPPRV